MVTKDIPKGKPVNSCSKIKIVLKKNRPCGLRQTLLQRLAIFRHAVRSLYSQIQII